MKYRRTSNVGKFEVKKVKNKGAVSKNVVCVAISPRSPFKLKLLFCGPKKMYAPIWIEEEFFCDISNARLTVRLLVASKTLHVCKSMRRRLALDLRTLGTVS